jgi:ABC-type branched-subunit amino acid transport system ATPase component
VSEPLLAVQGVDFSYGRLQVLFDVNLHVAQGEAVALLGTNGAGKSTLLRVVSGLERPSEGGVVLAGEDVTGVPAEEMVKKGIVLVSGGKAVFPDMTIEENLLVQANTVAPARARASRERVYSTFPRLRERLRQKAGSLSGGEQQQLALAKAFVLDPKILCIDELSLGLAPLVVQELMGVVRTIHAEGVTVILVEQSLNIAAELCERAVFMEKGSIRFEGTPRELMERDDIARAVFLGQAR